MAVKQLLNNALNAKMDRRQFLTQCGAVFLALVGITSVLHALANNRNEFSSSSPSAQPNGNSAPTSNSFGYGASAYGR